MLKNNPIPKAISLRETFLLFGIPGALSVIGFYVAIPLFLKKGYSLSFLFPVTMWIGILPLIPLALLLYKRERVQYPQLGIKERFRFGSPTGKDWGLIALGVIAVFLFDFIIMQSINKKMASVTWLSPPDYFPPLFNPLLEITLPIEELIGVKLEGNWLFLIGTIVIHTFMIFSEEVMWRGYILPRQEATFGKWAWLVNGTLWAYLVHAALKWSFVSFLPGMLITPYLAQKTKNTWVSFIVHLVPNTILWLIILLGVIGIE